MYLIRLFDIPIVRAASGLLVFAGTTLPSYALASLGPKPKSPAKVTVTPPIVMKGVPHMHLGANQVVPTTSKRVPKGVQTLLDEVARSSTPIPATSIAEWKGELAHGHLPAARAAQLHVWLAESKLAIEEPDQAELELRTALRLAPSSSPVSGLASYDLAAARFYEGRYLQSGHGFRALLKSNLGGYNRKWAAMFARHAQACAGYHAGHEKLGIPQPERLDPLCGVAALAVSARALGLPYGEARVSSLVPHHGMGSSLAELQTGAKALGMVGHSLQADEQGLMALPKPLVAHIERDHFVSVVRADVKGVSYVCSDCGPWPGGAVNLTWKQWRSLEPDAYLAVAKPGSVEDAALTALEQGQKAKTFGAVASLELPQGMNPEFMASARTILAALENHAVAFLPWNTFCGQRLSGQHCPDCGPLCPMTASGGTGKPGSATNGAPVNLATGEEEYAPDPDITVYNPTGPSITWRRLFNTLGTYTSGFGSGWSHPYNLAVEVPVSLDTVDPNPPTFNNLSSTNSLAASSTSASTGHIVFPNGARVSFNYTVPTVGTPHVACTLPAGYPYLVTADYDAASTGYTVTVTFEDRSHWTSVPYNQGFPNNPSTSGTLQLSPSLYLLPMAKIADRVGNSIFLKYGTYTTYNNGYHGQIKRLNEIDDSAGVALLSIGMDSSGNITSANDRYGRSVYYTSGTYSTSNVPTGYQTSYTLLNQVSQIVPTGTSSPLVRYQYGYQNVSNNEGSELVPNLHTVSVPSPTGTGMATMTINYNSLGFIDNVVDANGNITKYTDTSAAAGTNQSTVQIEDPSGNVVYQESVQYDSNMNETKKINGLGQTVYTRSYGSSNTAFRPSSITDGNGRTWTYTWDQYSNLLTSTTPKGTVTTNTYSYANFALGELTSTQQGSQTATYYTHNEPSGLVATVSTAIPGEVGTGNTQTTSYTYDAAGNLTQVTSPGNNAATSRSYTFSYTTDGSYTQAEGLNKPIRVADASGAVVHLRYDAQGNLTSSTDALGNTETSTYNLANQQLTATSPATGQTGTGNSATINSYLYVGGPLVQTAVNDESGNTVRAVSLTFGLEGETLGQSGSTQPYTVHLDAAYRTVKLTDGNNNGCVFVFDLAGRCTSESYPNASGTNYDQIKSTGYDAVGNILSVADGNGNVENYTYADADGLLTQVSYPSDATQNVTLGYDAYGRATSVTDATGSASTMFDDLNMVTSSTRSYSGISPQTISYSYWPDGSRKTMVNSAGTWTYSYDASGHYASLVSPAGTSSAAYLANGLQSGRTLPNGATTTYTYNAVGVPLSEVNATSTGTVLSQYGMASYDAVGNLRSISASIPSISTQTGTTSETYDSKDRLTQEASTRGSGYSSQFGYDAAGNSTTFKGATRTFDNDSRLTGASFVYDGNGNATTYNGTAATYDVGNRLASFGSAWTARYRHDGLRGWKQVGSTKTYYVYDHGQPVLELDGTGAVTAVNVFAPDGLVARKQAGNWTMYTFDLFGNVAQRVNASQSVVSSSMYDAFGMESTTGTPDDPFGFHAQSGYLFDRESGLYLCQHRYYDPASGRWLNRDPVGQRGGINVYAYAGNSPVQNVDSTGYWPFTHWGGDTFNIPDGPNGPGKSYRPLGPADCKRFALRILVKVWDLLYELGKYNPWVDQLGSDAFPPGTFKKPFKPGGHLQEINDLIRGIQNDFNNLQRCKEPPFPTCPVPVADPVSSPSPDSSPGINWGLVGAEIGVGLIIGAAIILAPETGGGSLVLVGAFA